MSLRVLLNENSFRSRLLTHPFLLLLLVVVMKVISCPEMGLNMTKISLEIYLKATFLTKYQTSDVRRQTSDVKQEVVVIFSGQSYK